MQSGAGAGRMSVLLRLFLLAIQYCLNLKFMTMDTRDTELRWCYISVVNQLFKFGERSPIMRRDIRKVTVAGCVVLIGLLAAGTAFTQQKQVPQVNSPEVLADGRVIFRISAPKAETVGLQASDIFGMTGGGPQFTKNQDGVWEATIGPIEPGAYRYTFMVNEVPVVDPRNPSVSESNNNAWSLVYIPGAKFMDAGNVPHGAVAAVYYHSTALGRDRRMHIYTPPGYELSNLKYPVFYLLHGAMDCDDSWSSVGRAGFILDNLIAEKKAKPMIVVMPAGHTSRTFWHGRWDDIHD